MIFPLRMSIQSVILSFRKTFELFNLKNIMISEFALKKGIILEMLDKMVSNFKVL